MEGNIMTLKQTVRYNAASFSIPLGITLALVAVTAPLAAQDTIVEGAPQRSNYVEEKVGFADLDLRNQSNQQMLISRVRQASDRVCDVIYRGESPIVKFNGRCVQRTYRDAKPQIDLAIANARNGRQVAISFVVAAGR